MLSPAIWTVFLHRIVGSLLLTLHVSARSSTALAADTGYKSGLSASEKSEAQIEFKNQDGQLEERPIAAVRAVPARRCTRSMRGLSYDGHRVERGDGRTLGLQPDRCTGSLRRYRHRTAGQVWSKAGEARGWGRTDPGLATP